jgi:hypothetical protein
MYKLCYSEVLREIAVVKRLLNYYWRYSYPRGYSETAKGETDAYTNILKANTSTNMQDTKMVIPYLVLWMD